MSEILSAQFWAYVGAIAGIYAIFTYGLQLEFGFAGLLNFGQVAFMAIGAYAVAILVVRAHLGLMLAALAAIAAAGAAGALLALPTVRLRADYFAIATIAISEILNYFLLNLTSVTGGAEGTENLLGPTQAATYSGSWLSFEVRAETWLGHLIGSAATPTMVMLIVAWLLALLVASLVRFLVRSPWGRILRSIREDQDAAAALGHNVFAYRLQALVIGSAIAGLAGVLYALQFSAVDPTQFDPLVTFYAWTILILGGATSLVGVAVGAVVYGFVFAAVLFFTFPPFSLLSADQRAYLQVMAVGLVLIWLMRVRPQGLFGSRQEMLLER